jgi:hypothetical protein
LATKVSQELTYDAPAKEVAEMLCDASFRERVCDAMATTRKEVTVGPDGGATKVVIDMDQPAAGIPGFAKKFVGDQINIVQTEHWSDAEHARVDVVIPGKPGQMSGTVVLRESGGTTTESVELEIRVNIPLVGGKIESLIADMLRKALKTENAVGREYLAG